jgi:hypothetical protein
MRSARKPDRAASTAVVIALTLAQHVPVPKLKLGVIDRSGSESGPREQVCRGRGSSELGSVHCKSVIAPRRAGWAPFHPDRSSTFKLALFCIVIFGAALLALFGYVYWSTASYVRGRSDQASPRRADDSLQRRDPSAPGHLNPNSRDFSKSCHGRLRPPGGMKRVTVGPLRRRVRHHGRGSVSR